MVYCIYRIYTFNTKCTLFTAADLMRKDLPLLRKGVIQNMNIIISNSTGTPIYEQIYSQIKGLILSSALQEGEPLPSMRALAQDLRISVITTKRAYEMLEADGLIESYTGKGSFVAAKNPELLKEQNLKLIEEHLEKAVFLAKQSGIEQKELQEIMEVYYNE